MTTIAISLTKRLLEVRFLIEPKLQRLPPDVPEQRRPVNLPTDMVASSIKEFNFCAADTETIDGKVFMLSFETIKKVKKEYEITPVLYYIDSWKDMIDAYLNHGRIWQSGNGRGYAHPTYVYYNKKFDAQAKLKHLPHETIQWLYMNNTVTIDYRTGLIVDYDDDRYDHRYSMKIFYLPQKILRFEFHDDHRFTPPKTGKVQAKPVHGGRIEFFDIAQFYGTSLNVAAEKHLNANKKEKCFDGSKLDVKKLGKDVMIKVKKGHGFVYEKHRYEEYYAEDIEYYCAMDTHLTGILARKKLREFVDSGVSFRDPYSNASIARRDLLNKGYREVVPVRDETALRIAHTQFKGGWFEAAEVGLIEDVMCFDLKSAYPANQMLLPSMTKWVNATYTTKKGEVKNKMKYGKPVMIPKLRGKFLYGDDMEKFISLCTPRKDLSPAYCHAYIEFEAGKWNPLCYVSQVEELDEEGNGTGVFNPCPPLTSPSVYNGWLTYDEFDEAMKWNPVHASIDSYCVWTDEEDEREYPFRPFMEYWFGVKESKDDNDPEYLISKILLNSIYGGSAMVVEGKTGSIWQPFYSSMTTAYTRVELARFNRYNGGKAVMFATDGIIIRKKDFVAVPERKFDNISNLGKWELEKDDVDVLIMMSGVYATRERTPTGSRSNFAMIDGKMGIETHTYKKEGNKYRGTASYFLTQDKSLIGWFDFCERYADETIIHSKIVRPYSMGESRNNFDKMNIFEEREISMRACGDTTKRLYDENDKPTCFGDLLRKSYKLNVWPSYASIDRLMTKHTQEVE